LLAADADLHRELAARIFDSSPESVSADERAYAKSLGLKSYYGAGEATIAKDLGTSPDPEFARRAFFEMYDGLEQLWHAWFATAQATVATGQTKTHCAITFRVDGKQLSACLPSGRKIILNGIYNLGDELKFDWRGEEETLYPAKLANFII